MDIESKMSKIIHAALLNGAVPVKELSKKAGVTDQQFRRELLTLQENCVLSPYTLINQFLLGWIKIGVYFNFQSVEPTDIDKALAKLVQYENVVSVVELFGRYQYFMSLNVVNMQECENFMQMISEKIPGFKIEESISFRQSLTLFKRKYLSAKIDNSSLSYGFSNEPVELDDASIKILNFIFAHKGFPNALEISQEMGIPHSTVHSKIKNLEKKGVIVGYTYSVDPYKLGYFSYDLLIKASNRAASFRQKFTDFCAKHPHIIGFTESVGDWHYELRVEATSPSVANRTSQEIYAKFNTEIQAIEVVSVCRELKYMSTPQIRNHPPSAGDYFKSKIRNNGTL